MSVEAWPPLKKCDNGACRRQTSRGSTYCCAPCDMADRYSYEVHENGPLAHTSGCNSRHDERGAFVDPTLPPEKDSEAISEFVHPVTGHGPDCGCPGCNPDW